MGVEGLGSFSGLSLENCFVHVVPIGALIIAYTILRIPHYKCSIRQPQNPCSNYQAPYIILVAEWLHF